MSLLDDLDPTSWVSKQKLISPYDYIYVGGLYYIFDLHYFNKLQWQNSQFFISLQTDLPRLMIGWIILLAYAYIQYFARLSALPFYALPFIFNTIWVLSNGFGIFASGFSCVITLVLFMKLYSILASDGNITLSRAAFTQYICGPSLVFQAPKDPKRIKIRVSYALWKLTNTIYFSYCLIIIMVHFLEPILKGNSDLFTLVFQLMFPLNLFWIVLFFMVFENLLNLLAEVTGCQDRAFYLDWWNSTTFAEFNYKWNRPVYSFLHRHVYSALQQRTNKLSAKLLTFGFSAICHEYIMILCLRVLSPMMVMIMMAQLPAIYFTRKLKGTRVGNMYFWFSMIHGIPLIIAYYNLSL